MSDSGNDPPIPRRVGLAEVKASFHAPRPEWFFTTWFGRPLGMLLTPLFYNTGWSANAVSTLQALLGLAACGLLAWGQAPGLWAVAPIFYFSFVLDMVDGNIARLSGRVSYWGKYLDGLSDRLFSFLSPLAAGIGLWRGGADASYLELGATVTALALLLEVLRTRSAHYSEWMESQSGPPAENALAAARPYQTLALWAARLATHGSFLAPLALYLPRGAMAFVLVLVCTQGVGSALWIMATLGQARALLDRRRRSVHDPRQPDHGQEATRD
ncbi:MAG: CDP-alcohol phosphatidyltransferase family protein [Alphaproteobacteria bacterium]|jgi:phosphatidylglycerophosphate synthase|nr:CDP-alcohol phosphatidyltransferase family protein [Alphaproteobacteria bacterium]MDP7429217.1 CDP-alcohol phosphatidyltransferase family protein [Alphaproteobacteria bacterium]